MRSDFFFNSQVVNCFLGVFHGSCSCLRLISTIFFCFFVKSPGLKYTTISPTAEALTIGNAQNVNVEDNTTEVTVDWLIDTRSGTAPNHIPHSTFFKHLTSPYLTLHRFSSLLFSPAPPTLTHLTHFLSTGTWYDRPRYFVSGSHFNMSTTFIPI